MSAGQYVTRHHPTPLLLTINNNPVYGPGTGLGNKQTVFIRTFIADAQNVTGNRVFYHKHGTNTRSWVHISDLTALYIKVVEAAVSDSAAFAGPDNFPGYYFAGTQEHSHMDVARAIGGILGTHGVIDNGEPVEVGLEEIDKMARHPLFPSLGRYLYASNSRTRAERAERAFGYRGQAPGLLESLEADVLAALGR